MCKHAICIMAHKNVEQINTLLSLFSKIAGCFARKIEYTIVHK